LESKGMSDSADPGFAATLKNQLQTRFLGKPLYFFPTIDSTNTYAARLAREGASEGTVVIADSQSSGKGRLGRIGVNLNAPLAAFPEELRDKASSLLLAGGQPVDRGAFTATLLTQLEKAYELWLEGGFLALRPAWERHAASLIGKQVTVAAPEGT